ncbi:MAG: hypothetical protein HKO56_04435 [Bacteroidia bacterium]|nr:hypothetical protein [Bacteroidia bacterium]NNC84609.1 hypothetical protein [Bacteroidia bacterium]NNM15886.1 hypothetical protein [Bacteroidia bacterium]
MKFLPSHIIVVALLLLSAAGANHANAQDVKAIGSIDTNQILIGEQITYKLNVEGSKNTKLLWPTFLDSLYHFEIIDRTELDTLSNNGNKYQLQQNFVLTNFDSGYYAIPPIQINYKLPGNPNTLTAETEAFLVTVHTLAIDSNAFLKDIKPPIHVPITLRELAPYMAGVFGCFALIVLLILLYNRYKNRKQGDVEETIKTPAHVIAFKQLQKLKDAQLWQNGKIKAYYSDLSDILRLYIENRYDSPALEMTTDEILSGDLVKSLSREEQKEMSNILRTADLAKFAKATPLADENELNLKLVEEFIEKTKNIEPETENKPKEATAHVE